MLQIQMRILRVFGLPSAEVASIVRTAREEGCPSIRLKERDGEYLVCVQASAPTQSMADEYCDQWVRKLRSRFGDAVYGTENTSLAQAALEALLKKRRLLVAADEQTGRLLGSALRGLQHSEAAFDFGTQSYSDPEKARRIATPAALLKKFPGDVVQAAAGRAQSAMELAGADYAAVYMPATVGQAPFVLVCSKQGAAACALSPELSDAAIANNILDLVRRRALGLHLSASTIAFRPGREHPLLLVSGEGQPRTGTRFTLRRKAGTSAPAKAPKPAADGPAPVGTITFEKPLPTADEASAQANTDTPDPTELTTMGAAAAAASRARRKAEAPAAPSSKPLRAAPAAQPESGAKEPAPSLLDGDIPDFSATLDPKTMEAARAADEEAPNRSLKEFQEAVDRLFEDDEEPNTTAQDKTDEPSVHRAAQGGPIRNRSLAMIEKAEKRRRRNGIVALVIVVLIVVAAAAGIIMWFRNDLGVAPAAKSYGTVLYDETAADYLAAAQQKKEGVLGYLGFPGWDGCFVYDGSGEEKPVLAGISYLGSDTPGHTVLFFGRDALADMTQLDSFKENSGFTLYLRNAVYRCKTVAVYYGGEGTGFDPCAFGDLSSYYEYLDFTLGIEARSIFDTGVIPGDDNSFITLMSSGGQNNSSICVTAEIVEEGQIASLNPSAIRQSAGAMVSGEDGMTAGIATTLLHRRNNSAQEIGNKESSSSSAASAGSSDDLQEKIDDLTNRTEELLQSADKLMEGLTDVGGSTNAVEADLGQGAEGKLPEQTLTVDQVIQQAGISATPAPTEPPAVQDTPAPTDVPSGDSSAAPQSTPQPTPTPTPQPAAETINVTMNGTAQTMELVQCLAMVAQNELGPNAPIEAYKAQCVATHCWILSQSGYPSVAGVTPGETALAAAREVAHVLVTYNGQVCFTPYFASASTGTASAKDVWGNERAWLQPVDSPYDQQVASNWNTNGATSGTARFSRETLQKRILEKMNVDLSGVDPNEWFKILSTNQYGWVTKIQIGPNASGNDTCSGRWFRETLLAGQSVDGRSLRSHCFTVTYDAGLDCFIFDVYGYGHGCGMSQWGAIGYARNGWDYASILTHYYPGTTLVTY